MHTTEFDFYPQRAFQPLGGRYGRLATLWGKDDTPAPDPRLVDAQIESLGVQRDTLNRVLAMSEELAPLQRQQLQQSIEQSGILWNQNQEDRQYALGRRAILSGIQDRIANESTRFDEAGRRAELAGQSDSDVAQAFAGQRGAMDRDMSRMGVNPNDGRAGATKGLMAAQEALARVSGRKSAGQQARAERLQLDDRANNVLAGYPAMTMQAQGQGVATMGASQSAVNAGVGGMLAPQQQIMSGAGQMGSTASNIWGQQNSAYQQGQAADAQGMQTAGAAVGTILMVV